MLNSFKLINLVQFKYFIIKPLIFLKICKILEFIILKQVLIFQKSFNFQKIIISSIKYFKVINSLVLLRTKIIKILLRINIKTHYKVLNLFMHSENISFYEILISGCFTSLKIFINEMNLLTIENFEELFVLFYTKK